jgi:hypothetical protein
MLILEPHIVMKLVDSGGFIRLRTKKQIHKLRTCNRSYYVRSIRTTKNVPIPGEIGENLGKKRRGRYVIQLKALYLV